MDQLFAVIAVSALPVDVKTDIINYVLLDADEKRRDDMLNLFLDFANLNGDEANAFEQVMRAALADAKMREDVVERRAAINVRELADKARRLAAIESIKKNLNNTP
jgi:inorganic triphosphatase YgiF